MDNCIFCKILKGEIPSNKIYEDDELLAMLDAFPSNRGHVLVITKEHVENIFELDEEKAGRLFKIVNRIAKVMDRLGIGEGINILQNNRAVSGQVVHHFHVHLIPRFERDGIQISWKTVNYKDGEAEEFRENIALGLK